MDFTPRKWIDSTRLLVRDLAKDGKGNILLAVSAGWFLSIGIRYTYPSLLPFLRDAFEMDLTIAGLLLALLWVAYALGQFPGGYLGDRYGAGNMLLISTVVSIGAVLLVVTSVSIFTLFLGTIAFGFATALYGPMRYTIFTDIYTQRAGTAVGLTLAAGSIGNTILPASAATIAAYTSWRLGFGSVLPLFLGVAVGLYLYVPKRTSGSEKKTELSFNLLSQVYSGIRRGGIPIVVAVHILLAFAAQGFLGFYPTYLIEVKGFSPQVAATLYAIYFGIGILIQPLTGMGRDRYGSRYTLVTISGLFFIGIFAVQFGETIVHFLILSIFISHRNGAAVISNTHIAEALDSEIKGSGLGLLRTIWILIGASSPLLVGYLGDLGRLEGAFLLLAMLAGIATLLAAFVPNKRINTS